MDDNITRGLIDLSLAVFSFYAWRKYSDKTWLWFLWIGIIGTLANAIDYSIENVFLASPEIRSISSSFFLVFDPVAIILVVIIMFRWAKKN